MRMAKRAQQILIRHKVRRTHLARDLGITASALWQWDEFPAERVIQVERLTGISRHEMRPDLYPVEESAA